jgi:hypothetical protein
MLESAGEDVAVLPSEVAAFGDEVAVGLRTALADDLVGVYFVGSIALGGYVQGESDIDIIGVTRREIADDIRPTIADLVVDIATACPARGLEFTLYRSDVVARPPDGAGFELNANSFSGSIRSDFPVTLGPTSSRTDRGRRGPEHATHAVFGDGSATLNLRTFSGDIVLTKR